MKTLSSTFTQNSAETADLRNAPIYKDRAIYLAYVSPSRMESADAYHQVIARLNKIWRVIVCREDL